MKGDGWRKVPANDTKESNQERPQSRRKKEILKHDVEDRSSRTERLSDKEVLGTTAPRAEEGRWWAHSQSGIQWRGTSRPYLRILDWDPLSA